ncbi:MAG TPA: hypothetical protein QF644_04550 [Candidatus Poseidoniaceae archaeon]|mgnify:CR=1 FL=1|jgi:exosome complex component RRP42|nr:hypothetical protein [Candidatus Poseidoniaceae archaeon]
MVEIVPRLLKDQLLKLAEKDSRVDGRSQFERREVTLEVDVLSNAEGSAKVVWGDTIVYAGVKFEIRTPWPDRPAEGSLMCGAELRPVAHRKYEPGPPSAESIELGRVVDRGIRESGCIDMGELCIVPGEKVWGVMIDIHVMSDRGNIFDACALAGIAALKTAIMPAEKHDVGEDCPLPVNKIPIMSSYRKVGGRFVYDPCEEEELGGDERVHITLGDDGHVHSLQKGLKGAFSTSEFAEIFADANEQANELRKMVEKMVN